jgi:threonine synthase
LQCAGCGRRVTWDPNGEDPFRCPGAQPGDDVDHVLGLEADPVAREWHDVEREAANPFIRYRRRLFTYRLARDGGVSDGQYCDLVEELDTAVSDVDGHGFRVTPLVEAPLLAEAVSLGRGRLWVKDETGNVSGSHKGRHLFGLMLYLRVADGIRRRAGLTPAERRLAIASCGNAALAAAVVARAAGQPLDVFIPPSASPLVVRRLRELGAQATVCNRRQGEAGDPCYLRFREAVANGAVPFCCQGPDNGITIDGGKTLAYEALDQLGDPGLDRVCLQVGGGAFASAFVQACEEAVRARALRVLPAVHPVQTSAAFPLKRAYDTLVHRATHRVRSGSPPPATSAAATAAWMRRHLSRHALRELLDEAASHRGAFMRPWDSEPRSIAHGILDDETYDWLAIVGGTIASGGWPLVASEHDLRRANELATSTTGIDVDHTGTAGLAGLVRLLEDTGRTVARDEDRTVVVFTGARRET